eukprot:g1483.t1
MMARAFSAFLFLLFFCAAAQALDPTINTTILSPADFESFHLSTWSVDFAKIPDQPVLNPKYEWEEEIGGKGTILYDERLGLYRAWYLAQPSIDVTGYNVSEGHGRSIALAESHDGVTWERPMLDIVRWKGSPSNLLLTPQDGDEISYANVFINTAADVDPAKRYEMMVLASAPPKGFSNQSHGRHGGGSIYRYYASDGTHWKAHDALVQGPCSGGTWCSDSLYINKFADGTYQAILKHGPPSGAIPGGLVPFDIAAGETRWIFVSNSTDGGLTWARAELALSPDWRDGAGMQVISSISTIQARHGATIGWLPVFDALSQTIHMHFCL